ncbi:MAG: hypothetical protein CMO61_06140 [Verrucomicrobiales bacterium]|jgi:uncharacterized RDD family membrane protein YckC|nr:hypothetical protein [Verrucomicrobiales bacterium]|tara:strand:- start:4152 stop:4988 length:837 start_codon:yes stop_codon:yes gene_type:complete
MEFYLSIDGDKKGPFTLLKVGSLLEDSTVTPETLAWHKDQESWLPISEIPALESMVEATQREAEASESEATVIPEVTKRPTLAPGGRSEEATPHFVQKVRPFARFWARMFDCLLVMTVVYFFVDTSFLMPKEDEAMSDWFIRYQEQISSPEAMAIATTIVRAFFAWHFLEAAMLYLWGTTPGKALFGIRVSGVDGGRPSPFRCLGRSLYVYVMGVGFYLFPFILIGMTFSFFRLMATGQSLWDQHLKLESSGGRLSGTRIILAIFAFFVLVMLQSLKI